MMLFYGTISFNYCNYDKSKITDTELNMTLLIDNDCCYSVFRLIIVTTVQWKKKVISVEVVEEQADLFRSGDNKKLINFNCLVDIVIDIKKSWMKLIDTKLAL